jgi:hypothetical protein
MFAPENVWDYMFAIVVGAAGGLATLLDTKGKRRLGRSQVFSQIFISGFAGLMVMMLGTAAFGLSGNWLGFACGIAGLGGSKALEKLKKPGGAAIGIEYEDKNGKGDNAYEH